METQQLSCCGIFELAEIGDNFYWREGEDTWNAETGAYAKRTPAEALRACTTAIREELQSINPRRRLVLATTVAGMSIAEQALRSLRFRRVRRFTNGNTDNRITLWQKYVR
jgi:hypothetical protein